jgi:hypothetical protein
MTKEKERSLITDEMGCGRREGVTRKNSQQDIGHKNIFKLSRPNTAFMPFMAVEYHQHQISMANQGETRPNVMMKRVGILN